MSGHPGMALLSGETEQLSPQPKELGYCPEIGAVCLNAVKVIEEQTFNNHPFNVDLAISDCTYVDTEFCGAALRSVAYKNGVSE